jgi:hypothetical protein
MKSEKPIDFKKLYQKLSEPLTCGVALEPGGVRYQKYKGERSSERIFVLSDEIHKENPQVFYRTFYDTDGSWRGAITRYLQMRPDRCFKHPKQKMYCLQEGMVTARNLDFDLDIIEFTT